MKKSIKKSEKIENSTEVENSEQKVSLTVSTDLLNKLANVNLKKSIANLSNKSIYNFAFFFALALTDKQIQKKFRSFFRRFKFSFVCNFLTAIKEKTAKESDYILQFVFIKTFFVSSNLQISSFSTSKNDAEQTAVYLVYLQILSDYAQKNSKKINEVRPDLDNLHFVKIVEQINYLSKLIQK